MTDWLFKKFFELQLVWILFKILISGENIRLIIANNGLISNFNMWSGCCLNKTYSRNNSKINEF